MRCLPGIFNPQAHNRGNHSGSEMTSCPGKTIGWNPHGKWEEAIRSKQDQIIPVHVELSWNSLRPQHQTYPDLVVLFLWQEQFFWLRGPICSQGAWSACRTGTKHEIWLMNVWYLVSLFLEIIFESFQKNLKDRLSETCQRASGRVRMNVLINTLTLLHWTKGFMMGHSVFFARQKKRSAVVPFGI